MRIEVFDLLFQRDACDLLSDACRHIYDSMRSASISREMFVFSQARKLLLGIESKNKNCATIKTTS